MATKPKGLEAFGVDLCPDLASLVDHNKPGFGADEFTWLNKSSFVRGTYDAKLHFRLVYKSKNLILHGKVRAVNASFDLFNHHPVHRELEWLEFFRDRYPGHQNLPELLGSFRALPAHCAALSFLPMRALNEGSGPYATLFLTPEYKPLAPGSLTTSHLRAILGALAQLKDDLGFMHVDMHDDNLLFRQLGGVNVPLLWDFELAFATNLRGADKDIYSHLTTNLEVTSAKQLPHKFVDGYDERICLNSLVTENGMGGEEVKTFVLSQYTELHGQPKLAEMGDTEEDVHMGTDASEDEEQDEGDEEDDEDENKLDHFARILCLREQMADIKGTETFRRVLSREVSDLKDSVKKTVEALVDEYTNLVEDISEIGRRKLAELVESSRNTEWYLRETDAFIFAAEKMGDECRSVALRSCLDDLSHCIGKDFSAEAMSCIFRPLPGDCEQGAGPTAAQLLERMDLTVK